MLRSRDVDRFITVYLGKQIKIKTLSLCSRELSRWYRSRTRFRKGLLHVQFVNELVISASFTLLALVEKYGEFCELSVCLFCLCYLSEKDISVIFCPKWCRKHNFYNVRIFDQTDILRTVCFDESPSLLQICLRLILYRKLWPGERHFVEVEQVFDTDDGDLSEV